MSKVSFRARALDVSKPMPIYRSEDIPDLRDFDKINRAVLQMPTGMEKEEETVRQKCSKALCCAAILDYRRASTSKYWCGIGGQMCIKNSLHVV